MTKERDRDGRDDHAPAVGGEDATERHLVKARELLREAQSRLASRDDDTSDSKRNDETSGNVDEDSDG